MNGTIQYSTPATYPHIAPLQPEPWMDDALCAQVGGDWWFPKPGSGASEAANARRICAQCPIATREACLEFGRDDDFGIYGGLLPSERRALRAAS